jgi:hypothetical protein
VDPNDGAVLFTGTRTKGLFRSADHGATWSRVATLDVTTTTNGNGISFVVFDPSSGSAGSATRTIYAGVSRSGQPNLYRSLDAGGTWTAVNGAPTTYVPQRATLANDGIMYLTYGNGAGPNGSGADAMDHGAVYRFDTQGGAFTDVSPLKGTENRAFGGISVDPADSNRVVATTINTYQQQPWGWGDRIFISENGGTGWTDLIGANRVTMDAGKFPWIVNHAIHWAGSIEMDPFDTKRVFVSSGNGIFMTRDVDAAKSTWTFAVEGLEETVPGDAVSLPDGPLVSVIGDYDGFVHTDLTVSPVNGTHNPSMGTTLGVASARDNPALLARVGSHLYGSTNEGSSWTEWTRPTADTNGHLAFSANGDVLLWTAGSTLRRRTTNGGTWTTASGIAFAAFPMADPMNANAFYTYDPATGSVYVSTDGGQSFTNPSTVARRGNARIAVAPGVEGDVWIALYGGGLTRSTNSGTSFQGVGSVQSCSAVGFGAPAQGKTFASVYIWGAAGGGPTGVYRSDDAGATWLRINDDAHEYGGPGNAQFVIGDASVYGRVFMSSAGRGIVWGELVGN